MQTAAFRVGLIAVSAICFLPSSPCAGSNDSDDRAIARQGARATERQADYAEFALWVSGMAALATAWAAIEAGRAANAAASSNKIARESAEHELRAYVYPDEISLIGEVIQYTISATIQVQIRNFGHTPAYRVRHATFLDKFPSPLPSGFHMKSPELAGANEAGIAPSHVMYRAEKLPEDPVFHLNAGEMYYVVGIVKYVDAFKNERTTRYCYGIRMKEFLDQPSVSGPLDAARSRGQPQQITGPAMLEIVNDRNDAD